jgi:hypothetical protein
VASVLTLADAKTHLDIDVPTFDTELQDTIDEAESMIAQKVGPLASTTSRRRSWPVTAPLNWCCRLRRRSV